MDWPGNEGGRRTADELVYLVKRAGEKPKEQFRFLAQLLQVEVGPEGKRFLDVGCATGESKGQAG
jgi:hypothetical protein